MDVILERVHKSGLHAKAALNRYYGDEPTTVQTDTSTAVTYCTGVTINAGVGSIYNDPAIGTGQSGSFTFANFGYPTSTGSVVLVSHIGSSLHLPARLESTPQLMSTLYAPAGDAVAWLHALKAVTAWPDLQDGWDGRAALAPDNLIYRRALQFVLAAYKQNVPAPGPNFAADGEIDFRWSKGDGFATVAFLADGEMAIYVRLPNERQASVDLDGPYRDDVLTEDLFRLLHQFG